MPGSPQLILDTMGGGTGGPLIGETYWYTKDKAYGSLHGKLFTAVRAGFQASEARKKRKEKKYEEGAEEKDDPETGNDGHEKELLRNDPVVRAQLEFEAFVVRRQAVLKKNDPRNKQLTTNNGMYSYGQPKECLVCKQMFVPEKRGMSWKERQKPLQSECLKCMAIARRDYTVQILVPSVKINEPAYRDIADAAPANLHT